MLIGLEAGPVLGVGNVCVAGHGGKPGAWMLEVPNRSGDNMKVEVFDRLACCLPLLDDPVEGVRLHRLEHKTGYLASECEEGRELVAREIGEARYVTSGHDEKVTGNHWCDVEDGQRGS